MSKQKERKENQNDQISVDFLVKRNKYAYVNI